MTNSSIQRRRGRFPAPLASVATLLLSITACSSDSIQPTPPPPTPEGLWTASGARSDLLRLAPAQLDTAGELEPATTIQAVGDSLPAIGGLISLAFDDTGLLWVVSSLRSTLLGFAPSRLMVSGATSPTVRITAGDGTLVGPTALAFDAQHRLWVANAGARTLVRFDPDQLAASGTRQPAVVLTGLGEPTALAFDAAGSLWVAEFPGRLLEYLPNQLEASGAPVPAVTLDPDPAGTSLVEPAAMAFDAAGMLWVSNSGSTTVVGFAPDQRVASGAPSPRVVLSPAAGSLQLPAALVFTADGSLWVVNGTGVLERFDAASLAAGGPPEPSGRLVLSQQTLLWGGALWPRPAGLPLR
jgi:streptogramin lyase